MLGVCVVSSGRVARLSALKIRHVDLCKSEGLLRCYFAVKSDVVDSSCCIRRECLTSVELCELREARLQDQVLDLPQLAPGWQKAG